MSERTTVLTLETEHAGTLNNGDEFKFQPKGPGTAWQVYIFRGHVTTPKAEWINCFGGDPIRAENKHDRCWRSFDVQAVREGAQPPGDMASGNRDRRRGKAA